MREYTLHLEGEPVRIRMAETRGDLEIFQEWSMQHRTEPVAIDVEATGLDVFSDDFRLLSVQFGIVDEAWVIPWSDDHALPDYVRQAVRRSIKPVYHNANYDLMALLPRIGFPADQPWSTLEDTRTLAHLIDPRSRQEGGTGHALKDLATVWVDSNAPDSQTELNQRFRELGGNKTTGWQLIEPTDPVLVKYAGLDTILTRRVFDVLDVLVTEAGLDHLRAFEYRLAQCIRSMQATGLRIDVDYTTQLHARLQMEAQEYEAIAATYGVENINSTAQVSKAVVEMGEELTERTDGGALKVDRAVLLPLADLDNNWNRIGAREPNPLVDAILRAKRADKWSVSYTGAFLELKDKDDRLHPWVNSLQARTARMSVSRPPLQQLPSTDAMIRRCIIPDEGHAMIAADYSQIEMRVLAALSQDEAMTEAILSGVDLHDYTAEKLFGAGFTKEQRKLAKGVGFGKVYGGGATTLARQTGADYNDVMRAIRAYDETFTGVKKYSNRLQASAERGKREVITRTGRHLPLDRDRIYAATNYVVQSTARDVLAQAVVDLFDKGLGRYLLLPIHDEVLGQAPVKEANEIVQEIKDVMQRDFDGVPLAADASVYGSTWANGYGYLEAV